MVCVRSGLQDDTCKCLQHAGRVTCLFCCAESRPLVLASWGVTAQPVNHVYTIRTRVRARRPYRDRYAVRGNAVPRTDIPATTYNMFMLTLAMYNNNRTVIIRWMLVNNEGKHRDKHLLLLPRKWLWLL